MTAILQIAYGEKLLFLEPCCSFEVQCLKSLSNLFSHTFIKLSWWIQKRHLFSAKRHSHKVKTKFSKWTEFPQHKLCLGEVRPHHLGEVRPTPPGGKFAHTTWGKFAPFCLPVRFYYITNSNMKDWDLLTVERNGDVLISAERKNN